jgi:hypothetical protein
MKLAFGRIERSACPLWVMNGLVQRKRSGRLELEYFEVVRIQGLCHSLSSCSNAKFSKN